VTWSEQAQGQLGEALSGFGETGAHVRLHVRWGPMFDDRKEWMPSHGCMSIDAEAMSLIVAHWQASNTEDATAALMRAFLDRYPLPGAEPDDVDVCELRLVPES
jgi:hypothetical protein